MDIPVLMMSRELGWGGIERDISKFARHLHKYGIQPHVATFHIGGPRCVEIEAAGIPVVSVPVRSFKSKSALDGARVLRDYIRAHNIPVVHAFDVPTDVFAVPLGRLFGAPVTISSQLCYRDLSNMYLRLLLAVVDRIATGLFVNCEAMADHLTNDWKVPRRRIHVCYNGVETHEFHPNNRVRPQHLADASVVIGTVAVLREEKNLPHLIEAFAAVQRMDARAKLLIVGSGPMEDELRQQVRSLNLVDCCVFEEATPDPADWMRAIDVFVLPSRSEAFSNALLEAMACGCCPVGSRVGGTPELIADGERGFIFEPGNVRELADKLCMLARDPAMRQRMGDASAAFTRDHLSIDIATSRLASIYKQLLQQSGFRVVPDLQLASGKVTS